MPPKKRKANSSAAPPPPPPALVRLLQSDPAVFEYFEALQGALTADVEKWKTRARRAEQKATTISNQTTKKGKKDSTIQHPSPEKDPAKDTTTVAPQEHTEEPQTIDDTAFDGFFNDDSSDEEGDLGASIQEEGIKKQPLSETVKDHVSEDTAADGIENEDTEEADYMEAFVRTAESLLNAHEISLYRQILVIPEKKKPAAVSEGGEEDQNRIEGDTSQQQLESPPPIQDDDDNDTLFRSVPRKDVDVAADIRRRFANRFYSHTILQALELMDGAHKTVVDHILVATTNDAIWWIPVALYIWRGAKDKALQGILHCMVGNNNNNNNMKRIKCLAVLEAGLHHFVGTNDDHDGDAHWIENFLLSLFGTKDGETMLEAVAFVIDLSLGALQKIEEQTEKVDEEESNEKESEENHGDTEDQPRVATLYKKWKAAHQWLRKQLPATTDLVARTLEVRKNIGNCEQRRTIWLQVTQLVLLLADAEDIQQDEAEGDDHHLKLLSSHLERQLTVLNPNQDIPQFQRESNDLISLDCAVTLADGTTVIEIVQEIVRQGHTDPTWGQSLQRHAKVPVVRVINLERRPDRLATFVKQALRHGLLYIKGGTRFSYDGEGEEFGQYAYDGTGRLAEAMQRLSEYCSEDVLKGLLAHQWCPNDLKPFDREAPDSERMVEPTPSEKACALSHISTWKGSIRSMQLLLSEDEEDGNAGSLDSKLWRSPSNILRLFKIAGFAEGKPLLPRNEGMPPAPVCVILEDDAVLVDGFLQRFANVLKDLPRDFHYCSLGYSRPRSAPIVPLTDTVGVPTMLWYLTGYCLSLAGAQYLVESLPVVGPVDSWIGLKMAHDNFSHNAWGTKLGVGAKAQPDRYPTRTELASVLNFHAYCAIPPLCSQPVGKAAKSRGTIVSPTGMGRRWRQRDTDIVYSGDFAKFSRG